jgi:thiol-disulfide isomerase/thioredoxin
VREARKPVLPPAGEFRLSRREWLRNAVLIEATAGFLRADSGTPERNSTVGAKSPVLEVQTLDGKTIQVHRQPGKVVLLDFMTTTCPSCKQASVGIQVLYQELGKKGFLPIAIALDPQASSMLPFYRNLYGLTFSVGILAREEVLRYLDHPADKPMFVPTLVLLDKQGRISMKQVGWIGEQELRSAVTKLLNRKT